MLLTFICSGNTCRSPLAVVAWQVALGEMNVECREQLAHIRVRSAGLNARAGTRATAMAQLVAAGWNADLSEHGAQIWQPRGAWRRDTKRRQMSDETIVTMTLEQAAQIRFRLGVTPARDAPIVAALGELAPTIAVDAPSWSSDTESEIQLDIPDPYGGSMEAYEECGQRILRGVRALAKSYCRE